MRECDKMNTKEFTERNCSVNEYGRVFDEDLNEYRNEEGEMEMLDVPDIVLFTIWRLQHEDIKIALIRGE